LVPYLPSILPHLFAMVNKIFEIDYESEVEDVSNINTYNTEEAEVAINMLSVFIEELKEKFAPYVEDATKLIYPLVNYNKNEGIRKSAALCLPALLESLNDR